MSQHDFGAGGRGRRRLTEEISSMSLSRSFSKKVGSGVSPATVDGRASDMLQVLNARDREILVRVAWEI